MAEEGRAGGSHGSRLEEDKDCVGVAIHGGAHERRAAAEAHGAGISLPGVTRVAPRIMASRRFREGGGDSRRDQIMIAVRVLEGGICSARTALFFQSVRART